MLNDVVFKSQDPKGSKLKSYLFDSPFGTEEEAVFIIGKFIAEQQAGAEIDEDFKNRFSQLKKLLVERNSVDFEGNTSLTNEYLDEMSRQIIDFILEADKRIGGPNNKEIIAKRALNQKLSLAREVKRELRN